MHIELPHGVSRTAAKTRIMQALKQARPHLGGQVEDFEERWEGDTLHFSFVAQGQHVVGTCEVMEHQFVIDAKLPLMWRLFEGRIERMLSDEIAKQINRPL